MQPTETLVRLNQLCRAKKLTDPIPPKPEIYSEFCAVTGKPHAFPGNYETSPSLTVMTAWVPQLSGGADGPLPLPARTDPRVRAPRKLQREHHSDWIVAASF
jgi:hypothetical protein